MRLKTILFIVFVLWALYLIFANAGASTQSNSEQAFDHSRCQYPTRETNPPNGCDNSDPACPETIKYGYDCQPLNQTTIQEQMPMSQNVVIEGK